MPASAPAAASPAVEAERPPTVGEDTGAVEALARTKATIKESISFLFGKVRLAEIKLS